MLPLSRPETWAVDVGGAIGLAGGAALAFGARELAGKLELVRRYSRCKPLVACDEAHVAIAERAGIEAVAWQDFLLGAANVAGRAPR